jgi:hypothetical protein
MHALLNGTALKQHGSWQDHAATGLQLYRYRYQYANSVAHLIAIGERLAKFADMPGMATRFIGSVSQINRFVPYTQVRGRRGTMEDY